MASSNVFASESEQRFILQGVSSDHRADGRSSSSLRSISIVPDFANNCVGSSRLFGKGIEIMCCIKPQIVDDPADLIEVTLEASNNLSPPISQNKCTIMASLLQNAYQSKNVFEYFKSKLTVSETFSKYWKLFINILIFRGSGNLEMLCSLATYVALKNCSLPQVEVVPSDADDYEISVFNEKEPVCLTDVNIPIIMSAYRIADQILLDPTAEEQLCCLYGIYAVLCEDGKLHQIGNLGPASFDPSHLQAILTICKSTSKQLFLDLQKSYQK